MILGPDYALCLLVARPRPASEFESLLDRDSLLDLAAKKKRGENRAFLIPTLWLARASRRI